MSMLFYSIVTQKAITNTPARKKRKEKENPQIHPASNHFTPKTLMEELTKLMITTRDIYIANIISKRNKKTNKVVN